MPTPEETMAFNNQEAYGNNVNEQVDTAQMLMEQMLRGFELIGMKVAPGSKDAADRVQDLHRLRDFVSVKQPTAEYDPQAQLKAIDQEIRRLTPPKGGFKQPIVQSATDNQRGK